MSVAEVARGSMLDVVELGQRAHGLRLCRWESRILNTTPLREDRKTPLSAGDGAGRAAIDAEFADDLASLQRSKAARKARCSIASGRLRKPARRRDGNAGPRPATNTGRCWRSMKRRLRRRCQHLWARGGAGNAARTGTQARPLHARPAGAAGAAKAGTPASARKPVLGVLSELLQAAPANDRRQRQQAVCHALPGHAGSAGMCS
jgi:hypothetical protein